MKILLVHGIGRSDNDPNYYASWKAAITQGLRAGGSTGDPQFVEFHYDDLFEKHDSGPGVYAAALVELLGTAAVHAVTDPISNFVHNIFHPGSRDLASIGDSARWHAGMVAQFTAENGLRRDLRDRLSQMLASEAPDLVAAHSLGTLVTFDFLHNDARARSYRSLTYMTFGSQINNPFVRARLWPGRIMMPGVTFWYHLFNPQDPVLTADISLPAATNFRSITTPSPAGHAAVSLVGNPGYLDHPNTQKYVWNVLAQPAAATRALKGNFAILNRAVVKPTRRALLIGINEYPDPQNRLEGCVNDVFLFSSLLQERGFEPENIRVVLDDRATASAIRERLEWLLEDAGDGMERVLFYSGHGAQLPGYNAKETVDHVDECLVPYDFAWTKETAITDDDFYDLYSDLPFSARFFAVFDCCHSGGLTRDGSHKVRGISPPDDIRHRMLKWNQLEQMWEERDWSQSDKINPNYGGTAEERRRMMGSNGITFRLGRGMRLRECLSKSESDRLVKEKRALYLPVLLEACGEGQLSYEYRHGTVSYGAFTFAMTKNLRANPGITFERLIKRTGDSLQALHYDQTPQIVAPSKVCKTAVPGRPTKIKNRKAKVT
jgi:hypothetical protein